MAESKSLADMAVDLTIAARKLKALQEKLREAEGEWTSISLAGGEVMNAASDALHHAILQTDRLCQIAREALTAKKGKPDGTH